MAGTSRICDLLHPLVKKECLALHFAAQASGLLLVVVILALAGGGEVAGVVGLGEIEAGAAATGSAEFRAMAAVAKEQGLGQVLPIRLEL